MGKVNFCRLGVVGFVTAQLLAGCVTNPEQAEQISVIKIRSATPVHITVSASGVHETGTNGTASLTLPDGKLSPAETERKSGIGGRLAALQGTVKPALLAKASAFATLSDGPLAGPEINALFSGLEVITNHSQREIHRFRNRGIVVGSTEFAHGARHSNGTGYNDTGDWSVTKKSQLCMDWFDWYMGDRACYRVTKSGNRIVLSGEQQSIHYEILN